ncbi:hypothetical protein [Streptomyces sp. NPDC059828]|uniref:hypothetical protein n=1 Tax=Streptomyces sp. NPDC059828 TaxID=3346965 RepID=UPI003648CCB0
MAITGTLPLLTPLIPVAVAVLGWHVGRRNQRMRRKLVDLDALSGQLREVEALLVLRGDHDAAAAIPDVGMLRMSWASLTCMPVPALAQLPGSVAAAADGVRLYLRTVVAAGPAPTPTQPQGLTRALQHALEAVTAAQTLTDTYRAS